MTRTAALIVASLVVLALVVTSARYGDRALPGTKMAGVAVGGKTASEARRVLSRVLDQPRTIRLRDGTSTFVLTATQAGASFDVDASANAAVRARPGGPLGTLRGVLAAIVSPQTIAPVAVTDTARQRRAIESIAGDIDRAAFTGRLRAEGATVTLDPPQTGRRVRRNELRQRLQASFADPTVRTLTIPVSVRRSIPLQRAQAITRQANAYLDQDLVLRSDDIEPMSVTGAQLASTLALVPGRNRRSARLGTAPQPLAALVAELAAEVATPPREPQIRITGSTPTVDAKGSVAWRPVTARVRIERPGRPGQTVDERATARAIDAAIRAGDHDATIDVRETKPKLTTDGARALTALIGTFTTRYEPGQPRVTNIERIARAIDRTVIAPGKTFSLNELAGERTTAKGYVEAPFIGEGNKIEPSVGGGVSQFSTTMYNAAYFAGLRLDSHTAHSLYLDRYPPGRESTLNYPSIDLRWTNDTRAPVLVRATTDATSVTVRLYGDNGGRRVEAIAGDREPLPGDGDFAITVTREIRVAGQQPRREAVTTRYTKPPPPEQE